MRVRVRRAPLSQARPGMGLPLRSSRPQPRVVRSTGNGDASAPLPRRRADRGLSRSAKKSPIRRSKLFEPGWPWPLLRPPTTSSVADCVPRGFSFARSASGVTSSPAHLDLERADLVLRDQSLERLQVQGRDLANLKGGEEWAVDQVLGGQVVNPFRQTVQACARMQSRRASRRGQRRVGIVDERTGRGDRRQAIVSDSRGRSR